VAALGGLAGREGVAEVDGLAGVETVAEIDGMAGWLAVLDVRGEPHDAIRTALVPMTAVRSSSYPRLLRRLVRMTDLLRR
jgi:hypothetical protein